VSQCIVLTIGYGNRSSEEFISLLKYHHIQYLIDVRSKPFSRQKEFNRDSLKTLLKANGIKYIFMGDLLGGKPDDSFYYNSGRVDYNILKEQPFFRKGIKRIKDACEEGFQIVLMCAESKPQNCHRSKLLGEELLKLKIDVKHIDENGVVIGQDAISERLNKG